MDRRDFLKGAAAAAGVAAATGIRPASGAPRAARPIPANTLPDPQNCPVEHIVVLMMENRSYDTYLGWLEGGRGFIQLGLKDTEFTDPETGLRHKPKHWAPDYRRCGHPDPDHGWDGGRAQVRFGPLAGGNDEYALAYYLPEDIPTYARLARQFTVFDDYYCSVLGPTFPNREYQHSAQSGGLKDNRFGSGAGYPTGFPWLTIWDRCEAAGVPWAYYFVDLPAVGLWGARLMHKARHIEHFYLDCAAGTLPKVVFVDPGFLTALRTDDHPAESDMRAAQAFVNNVVNAFIKSPVWPKGAFFVNYDEWGGFFDHVRTLPRAPDQRATDDNPGGPDDFGQLGFRVPCMGISPYSRKGYVHQDGPYEHTSILRFIEWRYGLEALTLRDANAKNIGEAFDFAQEPRLHIGIDQVETPTVFVSTGCGEGEGGKNDFEALAAWMESALGYRVQNRPWETLFGFGKGDISTTPNTRARVVL